MADTTLMLDDPLSSPDPLADEVPSSVHSKTRRIALPHHDYSMARSRSSSPMKSPSRSSAIRRSVSPRKQTFELDVGNERSPQRILVTVEADDALRPGTNRRLFPPSSPTRRVARAEETTTRKVPLRGLSDDEGFGDSIVTPRKRGRPRKSNGTPVPKSRKRAGTPLKPASDATRPKLDLASDASMFSDFNAVDDTDIRSSTPKPKKPRARKTPKRAPTPGAAPSSQIPSSIQTTGKKRGRPRKALMPEEVAEIAIAGSELDVPEAVDQVLSPMVVEEDPPRNKLRSSIEDIDELPPMQDDIAPESDAPSRGDTIDRDESATPVPPELTVLEPLYQDTAIAGATTAEPPEDEKPQAKADELPQQEAEYGYSDGVGVPMSDDGYAPLVEQESDRASDAGTLDSANPARQDTLTHASDFSMIAVESLPSFQASFQASFQGNLSRITEHDDEPAELGEATNMMINQTLENLRRSLQNQSSAHNSDEEADDESRAGRRSSQLGSSVPRRPQLSPERSRNAWSSSPSGSPRRRRSQPLSRQIYAGKARQADDSFSSIPESILHAATPGRLPNRQVDRTPQQETGEDMYEDSFSEIPEAVLEAATPAPARQRSRGIPSGLQSSPLTQMDSPARNPGSARQPNRLPTPDDTSSSNVDSRRPGQEEQGRSTGKHSSVSSRPQALVHSSPPNIVVQRYESPEPRATQQRRDPQREIPESPQMVTHSEGQDEPSRNLEAPTSARRPTLSPIVRVARTLQSVMSDKSSPEGLESNLGSPFRGSHSRQSSISKSPSRLPGDLFRRSSSGNGAGAPTTTAAPSRETRPSFSLSTQSGLQSSTNSRGLSFGPNIQDVRKEPRSSEGRPHREQTPEKASSVRSGLITSSTKDLLPSDDRMSWVADESPLGARSITRQSITQALRSPSRPRSRSSSIRHRESSLQRPEQVNRASQTQTEQPLARTNDGGDDLLLDEAEDDIWEVEASRTEPPEHNSFLGQRQAGPPSDGSRGTKIPNALRSSGRRFDHQDEPDSPSHILLDDSPQKPPAVSWARPAETQQNGEPELNEEESEAEPEEDEDGQYQEEEEDEQRLPSPPRRPAQKEPHRPSDRPVGSDYSLLQDQNDGGRLHSEKSVESVDVEEYSLIAAQVRKTGRPKNTIEPVDAEEEHSLVVQADKADGAQHDAAPARSRFFGGFDIMSFFSSPAALPKTNDAEKAPPTDKPNAVQNKPQTTLPKPTPKQSSLWSAGLFPSIAQKEFRPSPERGSTLFSSAARSNSTRPATESSPTPTPTPREHPSTPEHQTRAPSSERQTFPSIEQKKNFTPRTGQNGSTLFTKGRDDAPAPNLRRPNGSVAFLESVQNHHDSSMATEDSEYERVPPRDIPSRWDKTLSPSKSSFRSPMKPTTPGRVVSFSGYMGVPPAQQTQGRQPSDEPAAPLNNTISKNVFLQQPPPLIQPPMQADIYGQENELHSKSAANMAAARVRRPSTTGSRQAGTNASHGALTTATVALNEMVRDTPQTNHYPQPKAFALTGTTWTKAHWVRFDEILQLRRNNLARFRQDHPDAIVSTSAGRESAYRAHHDDEIDEDEREDEYYYDRYDDHDDDNATTRNASLGGKKKSASTGSATILGKQVSGQGESLLLEPWHLEVIYAFMQELEPCPWDERELAKRLFALIIGEERRRQNKQKQQHTQQPYQQQQQQRHRGNSHRDAASASAAYRRQDARALTTTTAATRVNLGPPARHR